jgi:hypothetical protein
MFSKNLFAKYYSGDSFVNLGMPRGFIKPLLICAVGLLSLSCFSQVESLSKLETDMVEQMRLIGETKTNVERAAASDSLRVLMIEALNSEGCFEYTFDQLTHMGVLTSPDGRFRLFNWNVPKEDRSFDYHCFILTQDEKLGIYDWYELVQAKREINKVENKYLDTDNWLGALYYEIIMTGTSKKPSYTLLGWDGKDKLTTRKVIDVLTLEKNGPRLGAPIFKTEMGTNKRHLLEYADDAKVSLKWHAKQKRIVFDHLAPLDPMMYGVKAYYIPDGTFDALNLVRGKWVFEENIEARLDRNQSKKQWVDPAKER